MTPGALVTPRYRIIDRLGKGGMGEVFEAQDLRRGLLVALKTLRVSDLEGVAMLKREFRAAADLRHPNLVRLYDLVVTPGRCFFSMELVRGPDLLAYVRAAGGRSADTQRPSLTSPTNAPNTGATTNSALETGPGSSSTQPAVQKPRGRCDYERLLAVLPDLLAGLDYLHKAGKVHRDLKPQNILVAESGAKILDFGILQERSDEEREAVGTPHYMAPEQALGRAATAASDMYAFGCLLFALMTGRLPFGGKTGRAILEGHVLKPPPRPSEISPEVPPALDELVLALLKKEPRQRPTARQVTEYIAEHLGARRPVFDAGPVWREEAFVGRSRELAEIEAAAAQAAAGAARLVWVGGESGIGKSHLVSEAVSRLESTGWRCYLGRCYEREELAYKALDVIADQIAATLRRKAPELVEPLLPKTGLRPLARIFPALARVRSVQQRISEEQDLPLNEARQAAFDAWRELLRLLRGRRPLCLVINDLQWSDPESVALLRSLLEGEDAPGLLIISTARSSDVAPGALSLQLLNDLENLGRARRVELAPFGAEETARLLEEHLNLSPSPELVQRVIQESGGNPYLAVEFAAAAGRGDQSLSEGPRARLLAKVASLPQDARDVLEAAVVAGGPIDFSLLRAVTDKPSAPLCEAIDSLLAGRYLRELQTPSDEDEVLDAFHDRVRSDVYRGLSEDARRSLHLRFAAAMESLGGAAEKTADHLLRGDEPARAARLLVAAAQQAEEKLAFERAGELYGRALDVGGEAIDRGQVQKARGAALDLAGLHQEASRAYTAAAGLLSTERPRLSMMAATAALKAGELTHGLKGFEEVLRDVDGSGTRLMRNPVWVVASLFFHLTVARRRYRKLESLAGRVPSPRTQLRLDLYRRIGSYLTVMDRVRGGEFQARFLDLALAEGNDADVVYALFLITAFFSMRDGEAALTSAREALARAEALAPSVSVPEVLAFGETSRGLLFWKSAEWENARDAFQRGADLLRFHGHGDTFERILNETFIAASDGNLGRLTDQEAKLSELATRAQRRHDRFTLALVSAPLAEGRIMLGDLGGAGVALSLCRDWPTDPPTFLLLLSGCASARLAVAEGRLEPAISQLEAIEAGRNQNGLRFASGKRAEVALLRATAELGLAARGDNVTARRATALRALALPLALPPKTFHANALRLRALARPEGAGADLDRAVEILESCRSPVELAAALLQRGAWRRTRGLPGADDDTTRGETLQRETGAADPTIRDGSAWTWR